MNLGMSSIHTSYELRSIFIPTTRIGLQTDGSNWLLPGHPIGEVTENRLSGTRSEQNYNSKIDFETSRGGVVNKDFGRQNNSMSLPPLDLTPIGTNMNNATTSPSDSIPVGTKLPEPTPLTLPTYLPDQNGNTHVTGDPYPDPSLLDSSSDKYNLLNDRNSSESNKKKRNKRKKLRKDNKRESSGSLPSDSDLSNNSDYRHERRKKKIHWEKDPIKLCARLIAKLLTTEYKSKIIKFKLDEDPLQRWIYFLTFVESLEMIFSQYKETC